MFQNSQINTIFFHFTLTLSLIPIQCIFIGTLVNWKSILNNNFFKGQRQKTKHDLFIYIHDLIV